MKRIVLLVCGLVLLFANSAEARRRRWSNNTTYYRPAATAPVQTSAQAMENSPEVATAAATEDVAESASSEANTDVATAAATAATDTSRAEVKKVSHSTSTAQGVANLMAAQNRVAHFGGNPGYEGCGCGATQAAAYNICCYANSGMKTVDVGYAQSASGTWYCCRRYR